jgi:hypothetical protein
MMQLDHRVEFTDVDNIFYWIQENSGIVNIKFGPRAFLTMTENGSPLDELVNLFREEGPKGYWVEFSLNESCAGWSYNKDLPMAIKQAFQVMINFAIDLKFVVEDSGNHDQEINCFELTESGREAHTYCKIMKWNWDKKKVEYER